MTPKEPKEVVVKEDHKDTKVKKINAKAPIKPVTEKQ